MKNQNFKTTIAALIISLVSLVGNQAFADQSIDQEAAEMTQRLQAEIARLEQSAESAALGIRLRTVGVQAIQDDEGTYTQSQAFEQAD